MTTTATPTAELVGTLIGQPTPAWILRAAADHIDTHGWHQGSLYGPEVVDDNHPSACALGGIHLASCFAPGQSEYGTGGTTITHVVNAAICVLGGYLTDTGRIDFVDDPDLATYEGLIGDWNDTAERTVTDVTAALRDAAEQWDRLHTDPSTPTRDTTTPTHAALTERASAPV
jgi:hypothetical protein